MLNYINKIGQVSRKRTGSSKKAERACDLPLDHQLTFNPAPDERWTYKDGTILLNEMDVKELVRESSNEVGILCGVSHGLNDYQQFVWSRGGKSNADFNGLVNSVQHTIQGRLLNLFDGLTGGLHFEWLGRDFWINNVNVRSVIKLYMIRPTEAARTYLEGLRDKVGLILARRRASTRYDGVYEGAKELFEEIDIVLKTVSPAGPPRLSA